MSQSHMSQSTNSRPFCICIKNRKNVIIFVQLFITSSFFRTFATFFGISTMRKMEVRTLFHANCLAKSNNSSTHSKSRAIEKSRGQPALEYTAFYALMQPMKQREKSQACLCSSESRQRSTEGQGRPLWFYTHYSTNN